MASTILADNGVSSGSAGLKSSADSTGVLALQTTTSAGAVTTAVTVDTSQNVAVGASASSTYGKLTVGGAGITIAEDGNAKLQIGRYSSGVPNSYIKMSANSTSLRFTNPGDTADLMTLDSSGNLLVGTTSPLTSGTHSFVNVGTSTGAPMSARNSGATSGKYWTFGPDTSNNYRVFNQGGVGMYMTDGGTSWTSSSDERLKDIIEPITNAADKVSSLRAVIGKYKTDEEGTRRSFLIAQDVQAVLPEAVNQLNDEIGTLGVQYTDMVPLLVAAIREQQAMIQTLTERITALEGAQA